MAGWEGFERVVDLLLVTGTDTTVVHDLAEAIAGVGAHGLEVWFADCEEMGSKTSDEPF